MQGRSAGLPPETPTPLPMIFLNRGRADSDKHLEWKVRLFLVGAALAMVGIGFESAVLVTLATLVLLGGVALRFLPTREAAEDSAEYAAEETDADAPGEAALAEDPDPET